LRNIEATGKEIRRGRREGEGRKKRKRIRGIVEEREK